MCLKWVRSKAKIQFSLLGIGISRDKIQEKVMELIAFCILEWRHLLFIGIKWHCTETTLCSSVLIHSFGMFMWQTLLQHDFTCVASCSDTRGRPLRFENHGFCYFWCHTLFLAVCGKTFTRCPHGTVSWTDTRVWGENSLFTCFPSGTLFCSFVFPGKRRPWRDTI